MERPTRPWLQTECFPECFVPAIFADSSPLAGGDFAPDPARPHFGVLADQETVAEIMAFDADLDMPLAGSQLIYGCDGQVSFYALCA